MGKFLGEAGVLYLWQKIKNYVSSGLSGKQDVIDGSHKLSADLLQDGTANKVYTAEEQAKLAGLAAVATSGEYGDLSDVPITTIEDGELDSTVEPGLYRVRAVKSTNPSYQRYYLVMVSKGSMARLGPGLGGAIAYAPIIYQRAYFSDDIGIGKAGRIEQRSMGESGTWGDWEDIYGADFQRLSDSLNGSVLISRVDDFDNIVDPDTGTYEEGLFSDGLQLVHQFRDGDTVRQVWFGGDVLTVRYLDTSQEEPVWETVDFNLMVEDVVNAMGFEGKADKVSGAHIGGHLAALTAEGNLMDSGVGVDMSIPAGSGSGNVPTTAAVESRIMSAIQSAQAGAAMFQGTVSSNSALTGLGNYSRGWYWVVSVAGTYLGEKCEAGDMVFCVKDKGTSFQNTDFNIVQTNLDIQEMTTAEMDTITQNWS